MIRELRIRNLAIIEDLHLEFDSNLNIMTGETGAGKSIILGALKLILGERCTPDDVRTGEEFAETEALIDGPFSTRVLQCLEEAGTPCDEDGMVLRREISVSGKSKAYVNGRLVPAHQLKALGDLLVDLHGQHQHQSLLAAENHLAALDAFAEVQDELAKVRTVFNAWTASCAQLEALRGDDRAIEREKDALDYQIREIDQAQLQIREDEALGTERAQLHNAEQLREFAKCAYALLSENQEESPCALDLVGAAQSKLADLSRLDPSQGALHESLSEARFRLDEAATLLRDYAESLERNPQRLQEVEDRLDLIRNLKRKYGNSIEEILESAEGYRKRLASLTNRAEEIERVEKDVARQLAQLTEAAKILSEKRRKAARIFEKRMEKQLGELAMEKARFSVDFKPDQISADGADRVEFLLSTNPGEALKPLRKIASGGELSRIMLAMKGILASRDEIPTLVFDEIDTGISGATAQVVGDKMHELSLSRQVICITHLPQIAVRATRHFAVRKSKRDKRMVTQVQVLSQEGRIEEVARLLGGDAASQAGRQHAHELLQKFDNATSD